MSITHTLNLNVTWLYKKINYIGKKKLVNLLK